MEEDGQDREHGARGNEHAEIDARRTEREPDAVRSFGNGDGLERIAGHEDRHGPGIDVGPPSGIRRVNKEEKAIFLYLG